MLFIKYTLTATFKFLKVFQKAASGPPVSTYNPTNITNVKVHKVGWMLVLDSQQILNGLR